MPVNQTSLRPWIAMVSRVIVGIGVGALLATAYWAMDLMMQGVSVASALRGEVEDAMPTLHALISLGGLIGGSVCLIQCLLGLYQIKREEKGEKRGHS